jgi:hypothetical protein
VPVLVKATTPRAYLKWLTRHKMFDAVLKLVPPGTAALMREPPLQSTWVQSESIEPIVRAVETLEGKAGVRRMSRETLHDELLPPLRKMATNILRLLGTSPATVYRHIDDLARTSIKGMNVYYTPTSERSGSVRITYDVDYEVPDCTFVAVMATLEGVLDLCEEHGTVSDPARRSRNSADYRVRW